MVFQVPRIAVAATTFDGLLARPTVPGKTVFLLNVGKAAGATKSLFYTFGSGTPQRACPFKPFFEVGSCQLFVVYHCLFLSICHRTSYVANSGLTQSTRF